MAKAKTKFGYLAKCGVTGCSWAGELAKSEREGKRLFLAHAVAVHLEIRAVPVKKKVVMEMIGE